MGVKVCGARAAASCPDFSLSFKAAAKETQSKVQLKPEQRRHGTALQGLLLASLWLGFAGFKSQLSGLLLFAASFSSRGRGGCCGDPPEQSHL